MEITWRDVPLPDFGDIEERPEIPVTTYEARCARAYAAAGTDWLVVYGDREHYANLTYLTGFDPRFEEAILLLGAGDRRILLVGNEGMAYASLLTFPLEAVLCQSLSLPGQDRGTAPRLADVLREAGLRAGQSVSLVGWKYLTPAEWSGPLPGFFAPAMLVDTLRDLTGDPAAVREATPILLDPTTGLRSSAEPEQIAAFEWAAARATAAVARIIRGLRPGLTELAAVGNMGYEGDPLSTYVLFASGRDPIVGLRSPGTRRIERGDAITSAVGFWGGLCARAGLVADDDRAFLNQLAIPYYRGVVTWYETIGLGVTGGEIFDRVTAVLAEGGLQSALNPGHLTGFDEWVHSPVYPGRHALPVRHHPRPDAARPRRQLRGSGHLRRRSPARRPPRPLPRDLGAHRRPPDLHAPGTRHPDQGRGAAPLHHPGLPRPPLARPRQGAHEVLIAPFERQRPSRSRAGGPHPTITYRPSPSSGGPGTSSAPP
jgi:hypothetical protein